MCVYIHVCVGGAGHSEPSALSEPGSEHNLIGASAFGYVSKITVINTIAI